MQQDDWIFSPEEKTVVRFSWADVYRQAGYVIRDRLRLPDNARLYIPGYTSQDKTMTMTGFSQAVNQTVDRYLSKCY